jgi:peptidoglycan/LPS O-acetylase OafA/YrhL
MNIAKATKNIFANAGPKWIMIGQGAFYLGVWPLISMRTFERVTGPKTDKWLVKTVGVLVSVIGGTLIILSGLQGKSEPAIRLLAAGSAVGLSAIDVTYVAKRRISPVYLLDAALEIALTAAWILGCGMKKQKP